MTHFTALRENILFKLEKPEPNGIFLSLSKNVRWNENKWIVIWNCHSLLRDPTALLIWLKAKASTWAGTWLPFKNCHSPWVEVHSLWALLAEAQGMEGTKEPSAQKWHQTLKVKWEQIRQCRNNADNGAGHTVATVSRGQHEAALGDDFLIWDRRGKAFGRRSIK